MFKVKTTMVFSRHQFINFVVAALFLISRNLVELDHDIFCRCSFLLPIVSFVSVSIFCDDNVCYAPS